MNKIKERRGRLEQWKNTRFVIFRFQKTVVRYSPYFFSDAIYSHYKFGGNFNTSDKQQSRNLDS